jgi:hypothetical protein
MNMENFDPRLIELYNRAVRELPHLQSAMIYQIAFCHLCKKRGLVFVCYKNYRVALCT